MKADWFKYIFFTAVLILAFLYWRSCQNINLLEKLNTQNEAEYTDSLKIVRNESQEMYHKYVHISNLDSIKNNLLKQRDEKILSLTMINIRLSDLISNNTGVRIDTIILNKNCYGIRLKFENDGPFYSYTDSVYVDEIPWHSLRVKFKPFSVTTYVTRSKDTGLWSSYIEIPAELRKYILLSEIKTIVDENVFGDVEKRLDHFRLSITPFIGQAFIDSKSYFIGSIVGKINNRHSILFSKGIGNGFIQIGYGWNFDIIK